MIKLSTGICIVDGVRFTNFTCIWKYEAKWLLALQMVRQEKTIGNIQWKYTVFSLISSLYSIRPPDKSTYWKIIFLISEPKHMFWVLKRTASMKRFFWAPKHMFKLMSKKIKAILGAQTILIWDYAVCITFSKFYTLSCKKCISWSSDK